MTKIKLAKASLVFCSIYIVTAASTPEDEEQPKIIGGAEISFGSAPYQAAVIVDNGVGCGGAVIGDFWVLTAAHCVPGIPATRIRVAIGVDNLNAIAKDQVYRAVAVDSHPWYNPRTFDYDVAVIEVGRRIATGDIIPMAGWEVPSGSPAYVTGWGTIAAGGTMVARLRGVTVRVLTSADCRRSKYGNRISNRMFCAADGSRDSCQGDSGGPIVSGGYLIGIVSWGDGCALSGFPGVYTKLANPDIMRFITNSMF